MLKRAELVLLVAGVLSNAVGVSLALAAEAPRQDVTYVPPGGYRVFPTATVNYAQYISGASVQITSGLVPSEDRLFLQYSGGAQIASSYNAATGTLTLTGRATGVEWGKILVSVFYRNDAADPDNRDRLIEARLGSARYYATTGHYYELFPTGLSWLAARSDASSRFYLGFQGYLATITSKSEQGFVGSLAAGKPVWLGAKFDSSALTWRWTTGTEGMQDGGKGLAFHNNNGPVSGSFTYWASLHPQEKGVEVVAMSANGQWVSSSSDTATAYVVEYGGLGTTSSFYERFSTTVHVKDGG